MVTNGNAALNIISPPPFVVDNSDKWFIMCKLEKNIPFFPKHANVVTTRGKVKEWT